jgi:hypothetical protein
MRSAALSAAIASGAMVVGPGVVGSAVASADLFGIGPDHAAMVLTPAAARFLP